MTEAEQHNEKAIESFKKQDQFRTHKIYCILSGDQKGRTRIFQHAMFSPNKIASKLFETANAIIHALKSKPN